MNTPVVNVIRFVEQIPTPPSGSKMHLQAGIKSADAARKLLERNKAQVGYFLARAERVYWFSGASV